MFGFSGKYFFLELDLAHGVEFLCLFVLEGFYFAKVLHMRSYCSIGLIITIYHRQYFMTLKAKFYYYLVLLKLAQ